MTKVDEVMEKVRAAACRPGWSKTRLARVAGLGTNGLRDLFNTDYNPSYETLRKVEIAIQQINSTDSGRQAADVGT